MPSNSLEDKLEALLKDYLRDNLDNWGHKSEKVEEYLRFHMPGYTMSVIKQAFADAGYIHFTEVTRDPNWMTGQDWYDRFEKEIGEYDWLASTANYVERAARRAAGLDKGEVR